VMGLKRVPAPPESTNAFIVKEPIRNPNRTFEYSSPHFLNT
jgi:hypothetical protein